MNDLKEKERKAIEALRMFNRLSTLKMNESLCKNADSFRQ